MRILKHLPKLATLGALLVLTACSADKLTSAQTESDDLAMPALPSVIAQDAIAAQEVEMAMFSGHGTMASVSYPSNAVTYQFTVNPTVDMSFTFGVHMVSFPKYTICDPNTSGYGASTWLNSCTKLTTPITMTATTWTDAAGHPQIDFSAAIRFYKNWNNQLPAIYLMDSNASMTSWGRVDYCSAPGSCVNEAANDSALATQRDPVTGYLFRLIRHFSGYNVWA